MRDNDYIYNLIAVSMREWFRTHRKPMMDIKIVRDLSRMTLEGTPGKLDTGTGFTCDTLELHWADNQRGISCITPAPDGTSETYNATIWHSPTLNRDVVRLEDKYGRQDCLLHNGNWAGEGPNEVTQVHGCTEVGRGYGQIKRPVDGNVTQFGIMNSVVTLEALIAHIKENADDQPFTVSYSWE